MLNNSRKNTSSVTLFNSEQLVSIQNGKVMTSSLQVANYFAKEHCNILRDIKRLECSTHFKELNFELSFYIRELENRGQHKYPMYYMTKDGFSFLVMGFTGKIAAKFKEDYINAFNSMEEFIRNSSINENEINEYMIAEQSSLNESLKSRAKNLSARFNIKERLMLPDALHSELWRKDKSIEQNLRNLLTIIHTNTASGMFQHYKATAKEDEVNRYKRMLQNISTHLYQEFDILP